MGSARATPPKAAASASPVAGPSAHGEAPAARIGEILGDRYRLEAILGQGSAGVVYEAQHTVVGRRFAVKVLRPGLIGRADVLERFRREAQAAGSLESENIASAIDFGHTADGLPFIVMEYLPGEDLGAVLARDGRLSEQRVVEIGVQVCRGLATAHAAGIIHRDLKPENLLLARRGDGSDLVKILDFGIAKLLDASGASASADRLTRTGWMMGTALYMAPEQARGERDIDPRADIYALGAILYEALCGRRPHDGDSYNTVVYRILTRSIERLDVAPERLADVVHWALAYDPRDRPSSVVELAAALGGALDRTPPRAVGIPTVGGWVGARRPRTPPLAIPPPSSPSRTRALTVAATAVGVIAMGLTLWLARRLGAGPIGPAARTPAHQPRPQAGPAAPGAEPRPEVPRSPAASRDPSPGTSATVDHHQRQSLEEKPFRRKVRRQPAAYPKSGRALPPPPAKPPAKPSKFDPTNPYEERTVGPARGGTTRGRADAPRARRGDNR